MLPLLVAATAVLGPDAVTVPPPAPTPIFGGTVSAPGAWPTAVAINAGTILCTGTLVAPTVVLTAAHCLADDPPIGSVYVRLGNDINQPDAPKLTVVSYRYDPQFCAADTCTEDIHDYGYVILAEPQAIAPTRIINTQAEWNEVMSVGEDVTIVGYGLAEGASITGLKREVEVPITRFSKSGLEFQAGGDDKDSCQGDSGGPAFATLASGEVVLAGITSRGYTCGKGGFYAVPYGGMCWLQQTSGLDLRPADCAACDCLNTDPNRSDGCDLRADAPAPPGAWLVLLALVGLRQSRKRSSSSSSSRSSA